EVEDLADSYNQMTLELKSLYDELQKKNSDLNNENHERQKAEAELKLSKDSLEEVVQRRTVDLAIARDTAVKASRSKSLFLANMSHELRTPLNAIIGYTEMLLEDASKDSHKQYEQDLRKVYSAGQHLLALVKDVLDLSKIEAGRMELELAAFKIVDFIRDVENTAIPLAAKNNNKFSVIMDDTLGEITADITKLRQGLLNLLSNAAKFTECGTICLTVKRKKSIADEFIDFTVSDTGIGLSEDQQDRIFQAFNQGDVSTTRRYGGTGLGLAICQSYCHMMGGSLRVKSRSGEGASFTMLIPSVVTDSVLEDNQQRIHAELAGRRFSREDTDSGRERRGYLSTILVITEDKVSAQLIEYILNERAYKVELVDNRKRGLDVATMIQPDVILFDIGSNAELQDRFWSALNSDGATASVPIVLLSDVSNGNLTGSQQHQQKISRPISKSQLLNSINNCVRKKKLGKILLLNKNEEMRVKLHESLYGLGWETSEAENVNIAMKSISREVPSAILLDAGVDQANNIELVSFLKNDQRFNSIPVIVTTNQPLPVVGAQDLYNHVEKIFARDRYSYSQLIRQINSLVKENINHKIH
ncbi:MAG: ATP-binding protein, partial [Thiohalomonadales bacterium]